MHLISTAAQLQLEIIISVSLVLMLSHVAAEDVLVSLTSGKSEGGRMLVCQLHHPLSDTERGHEWHNKPKVRTCRCVYEG